MKTPRRADQALLMNHVAALLSVCIIALALVLVFPIHMGLSAGIAAVSILLFTATGAIAGLLIRLSRGRARLLAYVALATSVCGLLAPQLLYLKVAREFDTPLRFDITSYVRFSGETSLKPTAITTYKTVEKRALRLAYYAPSTASMEQNPVVVILHGGGWRYGNFLQTGNWPQTLTTAGFAVVSVEYRLSSPQTHTWRDTPQDIHDALAYINTNAAAFRIDPTDMNLLGQSAGGHLALLEAYRNRSVASVTSLYAPVDLKLDYQTSRDKSAELVFVGGGPDEQPVRYYQLTPLNYITPSVPPTLIVQGTRDDLVDKRNANLLREMLASHNVEHKLLMIPLAGHSFENQHGGFATQIVEQAVVDFLRK